MKIDLLVAENRYNSTRHFAKGLRDALEKKKVKTRLFEVSEGDFHHAFYTICASPPDLTLSFSNLTVGDCLLGDLWKIPHLSILVDPAIYFLHQLRSSYSWISCVDEDDVIFLRSMNFDRVFSLPHAVDPHLLTPPGGERPYETVFFGSCIDYEQVAKEWESKYTLSDAKRLHKVAEEVLSPKGLSILRALVAEGFADEQLPLFHHEIDLYIRGQDRIELLKRIDAPHIWGVGPWERYCPHAHIHPPVSFDEATKILKKSRLLLNSSPRFKRGLHERILTALLCGCGVLTGACPSAWEGLYTYQYGIWELPPFDNLDQKIAEGQQHVLQHHTWDTRADSLLRHSHQLLSH